MVLEMTTQRVQKFGAHGTLAAINLIVVIESLPEGEWKTGRLLREDVKMAVLPYGNNLQVKYKTASSADELVFLLQELAGYVALTGRAPMLHIECHGDPDGLQLADGSRVEWDRLRPLLSTVNLASRMNLILVLACCHGGFFAAKCRYQEPAPFAYMIGPGRAISADALFAFSDAFHTEVLKCRDVTQALTVAGAVRPGITYFSMSAVGIFRIALAAYLRSTASQPREVEEPVFDQYRCQFFALDQFPENADRFRVTYAEVLADVEAGVSLWST
jgi:hypothetical protein